MFDELATLHDGQRGVEARRPARHGPQLLQAVRPIAGLVQDPGAFAGVEAGHLVAADHDGRRLFPGHRGHRGCHSRRLGPRQPQRPPRGRFARQLVLVHLGRPAAEGQPQALERHPSVGGGGGQQQGGKSGHDPD